MLNVIFLELCGKGLNLQSNMLMEGEKVCLIVLAAAKKSLMTPTSALNAALKPQKGKPPTRFIQPTS
jgi:hypothetical protein